MACVGAYACERRTPTSEPGSPSGRERKGRVQEARLGFELFARREALTQPERKSSIHNSDGRCVRSCSSKDKGLKIRPFKVFILKNPETYGGLESRERRC